MVLGRHMRQIVRACRKVVDIGKIVPNLGDVNKVYLLPSDFRRIPRRKNWIRRTEVGKRENGVLRRL